MSPGGMFSPPAVMMISLMRPVIFTNPLEQNKSDIKNDKKRYLMCESNDDGSSIDGWGRNSGTRLRATKMLPLS